MTKEIKEPFAGFKDFGACVIAQRKKGKSKSSANKICGSLQAKFKDSDIIDIVDQYIKEKRNND